MRQSPYNISQSGFSLVELSIVLVVVGILLGGILNGTATLIQSARLREADKDLELIRESLIGFVVANGRLPCADTDQDGTENGPAGCQEDGFLPFAQLGVSRSDPWGGDYLYHVNPDYAGPNIAGTECSFVLTTPDLDIDIGGRDEDGNLQTVATGMAVIVVSEGENRGTGAVADDEEENTDGDDNFIQNEYRYSTDPGEWFDDRIMWISPLILKAKMLESGRLP